MVYVDIGWDVVDPSEASVVGASVSFVGCDPGPQPTRVTNEKRPSVAIAAERRGASELEDS
jgi:hypothetical protein